MSLKDRFSEELRYLQELGMDFAKDKLQLARFLGNSSSDPDVERLIEAFAFLTAKLRLKLEDDLPELTHPMLQILWPNYLRPLPSATIIQFTPRKQSLSQSHSIPKGSRLFSRPVDGTACEYRTCAEVKVHPFAICGVGATQTLDSSRVRVDLETLVERPLNTLGCQTSRTCTSKYATRSAISRKKCANTPMNPLSCWRTRTAFVCTSMKP